MSKNFYWLLLLLCACPLTSYAGQGTIRETDTGIFVEYSGTDDPEVLAFIAARKEKERQDELDADKFIKRAEQAQARTESSRTSEKIKEREERKTERHKIEDD
jgi:hypothetical protein